MRTVQGFACESQELPRESREHFYDSIDTGFKSNPKRLWPILNLNSKSHHISDLVSMSTALKITADQVLILLQE